MSVLINEAYANPSTPLWAKFGSGGSAPVLIFGNPTPIAWFKSFLSTPPENVLDIQSFAMPTIAMNGKIVVQANWNINSGGQDALMELGLVGTYENIADVTSINASKGYFGTSLTMMFDYASGTNDWTLTQRLTLDPTSSDCDVGGTSTMSVIFYPTP